jgi:hypothetical protein
METLVSIFREVHDPRDFNARHDLPRLRGRVGEGAAAARQLQAS